MLVWFAQHRDRFLGVSATVAETSDKAAPPRARLTQFELTDQMSRSFSSERLHDKIWVASFFFAECPSVCPALNTKVQELQRQFRDRGIEFVSITCDPHQDTAVRLFDYSKRFSADPKVWHFLTGDLDYIQQVAEDIFQVSVGPATHSDRLILFGRDMQLIDTFRSRDPVEFQRLKKKITELTEDGGNQETPSGTTAHQPLGRDGAVSVSRGSGLASHKETT